MIKSQRMVLVPAPFQGHVSPMLDLGTALHSKGFSITIVHTQFNSLNPSNHPDFTFFSICDGITDSDISSLDLINLIKTLNRKVEAPFEEKLIKLMDQEGVGCIIYDALMYALDDVAEHLKLPSIIFYSCGASAITVFSELSRLKQEGYFPVEDSKLHDIVPGLNPLRFKDLPTPKAMSLDSLESLLEITIIYFNVKRASSIILNTIDCLEHLLTKELHKQHEILFFLVGPLFKMSSTNPSSLLDADANCIPWLDKKAPNTVLYVSLGSLHSINEKEFVEMAWGLANCGQPFLWVVRPGSVHGSRWIELLPKDLEKLIIERGLIVKWAPQKEVLAHEAVGGFWSHCGWNSTLESIYEGIPMICSPGFGDQYVNARYISHVWKIGLEVDGEVEGRKIDELVKRLMTSEEGKEIQKRATNLKAEVQLGILKGGSSYNSLNNLSEYLFSL